MATHHDLLDAIARIRAATGEPDGWKTGLSGADIAVVTNPLSPPGAIAAVLAKMIAAHPASFQAVPPPGNAATSPARSEGVAAEALREAENALGQQKTSAAQVDLRVVTAVLNAHSTQTDGIDELARLQREVEGAVAARSDLDTPAGARALQRYLIDKMRDIRAVVETAGLDSASKAALAVALADLYAASGSESAAAEPKPAQPSSTEDDSGSTSRSGDTDDPVAKRSDTGVRPEPVSRSLPTVDPLAGFDEDIGLLTPPDPMPAQDLMTAPAIPAVPPSAMAPQGGWGGGFPAGTGFGGGMPSSTPTTLPNLPREPLFDAGADGGRAEPEQEPEQMPEEVGVDEPGEQTAIDEATTVWLPDGDIVTAPSPELAEAITAAVAGTPIPEAFGRQGITIPAPGSPVTEPLAPEVLTPGDIGVFTDRHAVALGNGKGLLDQQIQPLAAVAGPTFLGWQHPPAPEKQMSTTSQPVQTAPS